jgi:NTE family protein
MRHRPTLTLALGGGAARGLAHLGVLRVLEEERVPIARIVGTSMGAVIGAMYAADPSIERVVRRAARFLNSPEFRATRIHQLRRPDDRPGEGLWEGVAAKIVRGLLYGASMARRSLITDEEVARFFGMLVDEGDVAATRVPFAAVAADLRTGEAVVLSSGSLHRALAASAAIPGVFPPVAMDGRELADGGVVSMVPAQEARRLGGGVVLAVNIAAQMAEEPSLDRGYEILFRATEATKNALVRQQLRAADVVVTPDVGRVHWADFSSWQTCLDLGERAMAEAMPRLREALRPRWFGARRARWAAAV